MTHPILRPGPYPFWRDEASLLHRRLFQRFGEQPVVERLYRACAEDLQPLNLQRGPDLVWQQALEQLALTGLLPRLIEVVRAEGPLGAPLAEAIDDVTAAQPQVRQRIVTSDVLVLDRDSLRDRLDQVGQDTDPVKVVLVRGQPKSGKTRGRYLFDLAARDQGADSIYLSAGMVTTVEEAVLWLFMSLGATENDIPPGDSTENAWYLKVSLALLRWVSGRGKPAWIAVDDLGPGPDGVPLMDAQIRKFFERLAVHLLNPTSRRWVRLMLIHYPDGRTPTGWQRDLWCEDRPDEAGIGEEDIVALIRAWASSRERSHLTDDHLRSIASNVLATVSAAVTCPEPQPRLQTLHDALVAKLRSLEAADR